MQFWLLSSMFLLCLHLKLSCRCGWTMASVPLVSQSHGSLAAAHAAVALVSPATSKRFASQDDHKHKHRHQHKLAHGNMCDISSNVSSAAAHVAVAFVSPALSNNVPSQT